MSKKASNSQRWVIHNPSFDADAVNTHLATSPWSGHRYFAYDLVKFLRPSTIVELGTHYGCSFFTFLQSVKDGGLDTACYAVDTWEGEAHSGFYGEDVLDQVRRTLGEYFPNQNTHLLRKRFDDALADIADGMVDLLHIDGFHSYDAVRHDFETWLPKLAKEGIVLFHDVDPSSGYGSARYWEELKQLYPSFEFLQHSWGLGILFPNGAAWHQKIGEAAPQGWQDSYRYHANSDLFAKQVADTQQLNTERWEIIQKMDEMIAERDKTIVAVEAVIDARDGSISNYNQMLQARDGLITSMRDQLQRRDAEHLWVEEEINRRKYDVSGSRGIAGEEPPFIDLGYSLCLFISRLHERAREEQLSDIYFFSREGYALKEMFDYFNANSARPLHIRTHYLEMSRRSSFLPSLRSVETETFNVLFCQYRAISIDAFLSSLALEDELETIAADMGVLPDVLKVASPDLPQDALFRKLLQSAYFNEIYERERVARRDAFGVYLASLTDGRLPNLITIVDVGWKGSIQDNLWNWLNGRLGDEARIQGYYIGLIGSGAANERNKKEGLLFSNQAGDLSPGFRVFNENRSLFEVLLPAFHGGPRSYVQQADGSVQVVHDPFVESEMIEQAVKPVYDGVHRCFMAVADVLLLAGIRAEQIHGIVLKRHARMVFKPTLAEIQWMLSVTHVENFGVFAESSFGSAENRISMLERLRFSWNLLRRRGPSDIGFWPYLTLRQRGVYGLSALYHQFRRFQGEFYSE